METELSQESTFSVRIMPQENQVPRCRMREWKEPAAEVF